MFNKTVIQRTLAVATLGLAAVGFNAQAAGDAAAGAIKSETCLGCHDVEGYFNVYPTYHVPKLWGQSSEFIVTALQAYKSGERDHATMTAQASSMTDQDMADIAAFFGAVTVDPGEAEGEAPAQAAVCASCHGAGGGAPLQVDYPILAGQYEDYLVQALRDYQTGARNNIIMRGQVANLTQDDIEQLAEYFSDQDGGLEDDRDID